MPTLEDSLLEHTGAVPPRSKAWKSLPQKHRLGGKSPPKEGQGGGPPKQHPTEHPHTTCHPHPTCYRSRAGAMCRPQCTPCLGRGRTPQLRGVSPWGKKKKKSPAPDTEDDTPAMRKSQFLGEAPGTHVTATPQRGGNTPQQQRLSLRHSPSVPM